MHERHEPTLDLDALLAEQGWLRALARSLVRDPATADDLQQETLLGAMRARAEVRSMRGWLATVARTRLRMLRRAEARRSRHERAAGEPAAASSAADVNARFETCRRIAAAVDALDEPFRSTVLQHHFDGESLASIARRSGVPAGTVRWRLHEAHRRLRTELERSMGREHWLPAVVAVAGPSVRRASAVVWSCLAAVVLVGLGLWLKPASGSVGPAVRGEAVAQSAVADGLPDGSAAGPAVRSPGTSGLAAAVEPTVEFAARSTIRDEFALVRARLVTPAGAPVIGGELSLRRVGVDGLWLEDERLRWLLPPSRTASDGSVALPLRTPVALLESIPQDLRPGKDGVWRLEVEARAAGFVAESRALVLQDGDDRDLGTIELAPAGALIGRVVDENGNGIPGAKVELSFGPFAGALGTYLALQSQPARRETTTSGWFTPGKFEFEQLPHGFVRLEASLPGRTVANRIVEVRGEAVEIEPLVLRVATDDRAVRERKPVVVRVWTAAREPLPFAFVQVREDGGGGSSGSADARGVFEYWYVEREQSTRLWVFAADARPGVVPEQRHGRALLPSADPSRGSIDLVLATAPEHEITVRDADGRAIENAWVGFDLDADGDREVMQKTSVAGLVALSRPIAPCSLVVSAEGFAERHLDVPAPDLLDERIEVVLQRVQGIRGRVVAAGGAPVTGARVLVLRPDAHQQAQGLRAELFGKGRFDALSAADGSFTVFPEQDEQAPFVRLRITADGHAPLLTGELRFGDDAGTCQLSRGGSLVGTVRDASGAPVPRRIVGLNDYTGHVASTIADANGRYRFEHLRPANYELVLLDRVDDDSWGRSTLDRSAAARPLAHDLRIEQGEETRCDVVVDRCVLRVVVRGDELADLRAGTAELTRAHDRRGVAVDRTGSANRFELASPFAGPHRLRIVGVGKDGGSLEVDVDVDLQAGARELTIAFAAARARVALPPLPAKGTLVVEVERDGLAVSAAVRVDAEARMAELPLAPLGRARLVLRTARGAVSLGEIDVTASR